MNRENQIGTRERPTTAVRAYSRESVSELNRPVVGRACHGRAAALVGGAVLSLLLLAVGARAQEPVLPYFPCQLGWLGGDVGYSIPLDNSNRVLWLFGDTYVRHDSQLSRDGADIVHNTIAIRTSDGANQTINYYWQDQNTWHPKAFFASGTDNWRYWPRDGFLYNGKLYVCLLRVQFDEVNNSQLIGVDLASVSNPQAAPPDWQITYSRLTTSWHVFPGVSTVVDGDYVYLFAVRDDHEHEHNRPVYLMRIPLSALDANPGANLEYWVTGDVWKPLPIGDDAQAVMNKGATEMTVRWHSNLNRWVAVSTSNEFPARYIWRRQAPSLAGPWSEPVSIHSFPEDSQWEYWHDHHHFFYGAKEHSEFLNASNGTSVVTYVANSSSFWDVADDFSLYVPRARVFTVDPSPKGTYRGLFQDTNAVAAQSCGSITIQSAKNGEFTGTLQMGNIRYPLRGTFDDTGAGTATVWRQNLTPLTVALQVDRAAGQDHIEGTVSDGTWTAPLGADRAVYDGHLGCAPQSGHYTMVLTGSHDSSSAPAGDGYATVWIDKAGWVQFSGRLADGTPIRQTARLAGTGLWPLYIPLYRGQGYLAGWVPMPTDTNTFSGSLQWVKPAAARANNYPEGFALKVAFNGSTYSHRSSAAPVLDLTTAQLTLAGGGLTQSITNPLLLGSGTQVKDLGSNRLRLSFSAATGAFTGRMVDPVTGRPVAFQGVVLQDQQIGSGYFLGPEQSGWVLLSAP